MGHIGDPAHKADAFAQLQLVCQRLEGLCVLAVAADEQLQPGVALPGFGKGAQQGGDVLHRGQPGQNAQHHVTILIIDACGLQPGVPVKGRGLFLKIQAVVNAHALVGVEAPADEHIFEQLGDGDIIVQVPQGTAVHGADGVPLGGAVHIVQLIVAVHRGDDGDAAEQLDQQAGDVGLGPVTVDDIGLFRPHQPDEAEVIIGHKPGKQGPGADARRLCRIRKVAAAQAHQGQVIALLQLGAQRQDMGLGAAPVAAAGNVEYFHTRNLLVMFAYIFIII